MMDSPAFELPLPSGGNRQYQAYARDEDTERSKSHYDADPEFYCTFTGGEWNSYSCVLWEDGLDITQAQERKFDLFAELLQLKPGMHVLDVGCGWGGPLTYLCQRYGVTGHGIAVSPKQIAYARDRAARAGVDATFELMHWQDLPETEAFDAIYSDEVIVHFNDLQGFFSKCHALLKPGSLMAHKEIHLTRASYGVLGALGEHINRAFGYTGNYISLHQELRDLDEGGFALESIVEIPMTYHQRTVDLWLDNLFDNRERLKAITDPEFYRNFRMTLKAYRHLFGRTNMLHLHVVVSRRPE
jgi:cyclopropane-fatty-acyl-phospholipid synthase